tara:strand:- start:298 stop:435 length:138 start_codon:yes stop_codon:yes gene_type:complete
MIAAISVIAVLSAALALLRPSAWSFFAAAALNAVAAWLILAAWLN